MNAVVNLQMGDIVEGGGTAAGKGAEVLAAGRAEDGAELGGGGRRWQNLGFTFCS